jgi:hypothetical protein
MASVCRTGGRHEIRFFHYRLPSVRDRWPASGLVSHLGRYDLGLPWGCILCGVAHMIEAGMMWAEVDVLIIFLLGSLAALLVSDFIQETL